MLTITALHSRKLRRLFLAFLALFFFEELFYGDFWSLGLLSTSPEQMTKAALAGLSYTSAVRPCAGAGRRSLTSYNVLGSQPAQSKGFFGPVTLTGQRALLACYRSHTLSDFYSLPLCSLFT